LAAPIAVDHFAGQCAKRHVDVKSQTFRFYRSRTAALRRSIDVVDWLVMADVRTKAGQLAAVIAGKLRLLISLLI